MHVARFSVYLLWLLLACVGLAQSPQDIAGRWQGAIEIPGSPLEVLVTFQSPEPGLTGTVDIPAQGAQGLPLTGVKRNGSTLTFSIQGVPGNATFKGTLVLDTIKGTFSQSGQNFPFTLSKVEQAMSNTGGAVTGGAAIAGGESGGEISGGAANLSPKAALERLFIGGPVQAEWFSESFLSQVPVSQLSAILRDLTDQLGRYEGVEGGSSPFTLRFAQGSATAQIALDEQGKISGLFFSDLANEVGSLEEAVAQLRALPGQVGVTVLENGQERAAANADTPLGVGSAFKLAVLATLQDQIKAGTHAWDEVVTLEPKWKGLPSGTLQTWPDGAPLTLQTLATLMISISDNTATDALINIVGREAIEAKTERNRPFLTTQEAFKLKNPQNKAFLERYLAGDEAAKRTVSC